MNPWQHLSSFCSFFLDKTWGLKTEARSRVGHAALSGLSISSSCLLLQSCPALSAAAPTNMCVHTFYRGRHTRKETIRGGTSVLIKLWSALESSSQWKLLNCLRVTFRPHYLKDYAQKSFLLLFFTFLSVMNSEQTNPIYDGKLYRITHALLHPDQLSFFVERPVLGNNFWNVYNLSQDATNYISN